MSTHETPDLPDAVHDGTMSRRDFAKKAVALGASAATLGALAQASLRPAAAATTITLWHGWTGADNTTTLNAVLDRFDHTSRGITVKPTALQWDTLFSKWVIAAATGSPPDVTMYHVTEIAEYAKRGITRPIDDLIKGAGIDLTGLPAAALRSVQYNGQTYAVPGDLHPLALYYNVDMVRKAGLDPHKPPTTKDQFLHWADRLTVRGPGGKVSQYGVYLPTTGGATGSAIPRWVWWSLLHQNGGSFLDRGGTSAVNSAASRDALQFLVDLFKTHKVVTPGSTGNGIDPVAAKRAAMWFIGPWEVNQRMQQKLNFATAPMPVIGHKPATWANSHCQSVSKQRGGGNYEADAAFMKWFSENYAQPAKVVGVIPLNPAVRASKEFVDDPHYAYYKAFIPELDYAVVEPTIPQYTSIFSFGKPTPLITNIEAALAGSKTVGQALTDMKAGIDTQLAQPF